VALALALALTLAACSHRQPAAAPDVTVPSTTTIALPPVGATGPPETVTFDGTSYRLQVGGPVVPVPHDLHGVPAPAGWHYVLLSVLEVNLLADRPEPVYYGEGEGTAGIETGGSDCTTGLGHLAQDCIRLQMAGATAPAAIPPGGQARVELVAGPVADGVTLRGRLALGGIYVPGHQAPTGYGPPVRVALP
jgi:hypothetical protein